LRPIFPAETERDFAFADNKIESIISKPAERDIGSDAVIKAVAGR
jgi:hypothetical protein